MYRHPSLPGSNHCQMFILWTYMQWIFSFFLLHRTERTKTNYTVPNSPQRTKTHLWIFEQTYCQPETTWLVLAENAHRTRQQCKEQLQVWTKQMLEPGQHFFSFVFFVVRVFRAYCSPADLEYVHPVAADLFEQCPQTHWASCLRAGWFALFCVLSIQTHEMFEALGS